MQFENKFFTSSLAPEFSFRFKLNFDKVYESGCDFIPKQMDEVKTVLLIDAS